MGTKRAVGSFFILLLVGQPTQSQVPNVAKFVELSPESSEPADRVHVKSAAEFHAEERSRRSHAPANASREGRGDFSDIVNGFEPLTQRDILRIKNTKAMPPTSCKSIYEVPKHEEHTNGPWWTHEMSFHLFTTKAGFGFMRMGISTNARGMEMGTPGIDRIELVSLLICDEPSVYVLHEFTTPPVARIARRRPLDEFEQLGLDAVRQGLDLVATTEAPNRMFGAIRAGEKCLECHTGAKENDLLGAFSYYLEVPVDHLDRAPCSNGVRGEELKRHAYDPASSPKTSIAIRTKYLEHYSGEKPLTEDDIIRIKNTIEMPPTSGEIRSLRDGEPPRAWRAHKSTVEEFTSATDIGLMQKETSYLHGKKTTAPGIVRVELVSLLVNNEPPTFEATVYILDEVATPPVARQARRRPLDQFEKSGLSRLREGRDLVTSHDDPNRMLGAIRATKKCLACHTEAREKDLLGAFTYYLDNTLEKHAY